MNGGITGVSNNIFLGDSVDTNKKKVSLNLNNKILASKGVSYCLLVKK